MTCNVVIVGGGIAGVHTAYRLATVKQGNVCLFEKESRLGGRILDLNTPGASDELRIGAGARRFHDQQTLVQLADELGIKFVRGYPVGEDLFIARNNRASSKDELAKLAYPSLKHLDSGNEDGDIERFLFKRLLERQDIGSFRDFPSYVRHTIGLDGYQYLIDTAAFKGDYQYPLSPNSYLDWLVEEQKLPRDPLYPVGGMSEFITKMTAIAEASGVLIFKAEPVASIDHSNNGYEIITKHYRVSAKCVVIAVNALSLASIGGTIADKIKISPQYQQLIGIKVVTITQWWPQAWWTTSDSGTKTRRARTTEHCIGYMEIPVDSYANSQAVTRTVYNDDLACIALWEHLARISIEAVNAEISSGLHHLFPHVNIPPPKATYIQVWQDAWYWLKAGSPFTNADIAKWAIKPIPGEAVSLVGESYNPQRSTWSDSAIKSSIATLVSNFNFDPKQ